MVLWEKESNRADALFVNLFAGKTQSHHFKEWDRKLQNINWKNDFFYGQYNPGKNNQTSDFLRIVGNALFSDGEWLHAMEFYSQSLCFAEPGTNNVSLSYANRATCFLNLKRYDECLRDIESAEQANYPHKAKLMQRKEKCQHLMQSATTKDKFDLKLSFDPSVEFPCMANVLEVRRNEEFGCHVVANTDIDVGKTVLVEKFFISHGCAPDRVQCYNCTKEEANFIPCDGCTDVMFCTEECRSQNIIHRKFCGETINRMPHDVRYVAELLFLGIIGFSSANEMMSFVEETLAQRSTHVPSAINDLRSKYRQFLSLQPTKQNIDINQIYQIFTALMDISSIKGTFNTEKNQRFLMHLAAEHWSIIKNNSFNIKVPNGVTAQNLGLVLSLFNHSCAPNLFINATADTEIFITTRPIKKGEQVFIDYKGHEEQPGTVLRQLSFFLGFDFLCKCDKCEPHCEADRSDMKSDPNFKYLKSLQKHEHKLPNVKVKCEAFLGKFGHLPWSEEMEFVSNIYKDNLFDLIMK